MADISMFKKIYDGIKDTKDTVQTLIEIKQDVVVNAKVHDVYAKLNNVQNQLMDLQQNYMEIANDKHELESEINRLKQWNEDKKRYRSYKLPAGSFVYMIDPGLNHGEPEHFLCPNCYQDNLKSILQPHIEHEFSGHSVLCCPRCGNTYLDENILLDEIIDFEPTSYQLSHD